MKPHPSSPIALALWQGLWAKESRRREDARRAIVAAMYPQVKVQAWKTYRRYPRAEPEDRRHLQKVSTLDLAPPESCLFSDGIMAVDRALNTFKTLKERRTLVKQAIEMDGAARQKLAEEINREFVGYVSKIIENDYTRTVPQTQGYKHNVATDLGKMQRAYEELWVRGRTRPSDEEIAKESGLSTRRIARIRDSRCLMQAGSLCGRDEEDQEGGELSCADPCSNWDFEAVDIEFSLVKIEKKLKAPEDKVVLRWLYENEHTGRGQYRALAERMAELGYLAEAGTWKVRVYRLRKWLKSQFSDYAQGC